MAPFNNEESFPVVRKIMGVYMYVCMYPCIHVNGECIHMCVYASTLLLGIQVYCEYIDALCANIVVDSILGPSQFLHVIQRPDEDPSGIEMLSFKR